MHQRLIAGCDEVGYGAFFGPVVAGAVLIDLRMEHLLIGASVRDSKKISNEEKRQELANFIQQNVISYAIGQASVEEIDTLGIKPATLLSMKRAVLGLETKPALLLIDGVNEIPDLDIPQESVIDGDDIEPVISAASIVAKVYRDNLIRNLDLKYPGYGLAQNKGYGTEQHREAIRRLGLTPSHRPLHCQKYSKRYAKIGAN